MIDFTNSFDIDKVTNDYLLMLHDANLHIYDQWQHLRRNHDDLYAHFKLNTLF